MAEDRGKKMLEILEDPVKRKAFTAFCVSQVSTENLGVWTAAGDYAAIPEQSARIVKAKEIIVQYVAVSAREQVNMPEGTRTELCARVAAGEAPSDLFAKLREAAFKDMAGDALPRFLRSSQWKEVQEAKTEEEATPTRRLTAGKSAPVITGSPSRQYEAIVQHMRKKKFLGMKYHSRHSKKDLDDFAKLGAVIRSDASKMGFLMKRGDGHQTWKRRWCVLSSTGLGYFLDEYRFAPKGVVLAHEMVEVIPDMDAELALRFTLGLRTHTRTYCIQAANDRDRARWVAALKDAVETPVVEAAPASRGSVSSAV